jgi:hypothetical protein
MCPRRTFAHSTKTTKIAEEENGCDIHIGHVWFSFFLTSFSENLFVGRIWMWRESEYHYDYV